MPIALQQLDHPTALHYHFSGAISRDDIDTLHHTETAYFDALNDDDRVAVVADFSGVDTIPADLLPQLGQLRLLHDPRVRRTVIAGANPYLRAMAISLGIFAQADQPFTFCSSVTDAFDVVV